MQFTPISPDEDSEASTRGSISENWSTNANQQKYREIDGISERSSNDNPSIINYTTQTTTFIPIEQVIINQETELQPIGTFKLGFLN